MKPAYFAQKYIRTLTKTASAIELGPSACWMLSIIATQEDAKRYTEPAKWYYEQLMPLCGFTSRKQLSRAISRAVEFGWLEYKPGRKGRPCYFTTCIPDRYIELPTGACDESEYSSESEPKAELHIGSNCKSRSRIGTASAPKGKRKGRTSIPSPKPCPSTFDSWYEIYPRKVAKGAAEKAHAKAVAKIAKQDKLNASEAAEKLHAWTQKRLPQLLAVEAKFRPHPSTWLNDGRYHDELASPGVTKQSAVAKPDTKQGDYIRKPKNRGPAK